MIYMLLEIVVGIILGETNIIVIEIIIGIVFGFVLEIVLDIVVCYCYRNF